MGTSFRCNDSWDRLGGQGLVMIGWWYPRQPLTILKSNTCPPKRSQKPSLRKLVPIPLLVSGVGNSDKKSDITVGSLPRTQPDVSLSRLKCARKGRREGVFTLPMVPCGSTPVTRVSRSPLRREQRSAWGGGWLGALFKGQRQWHKSKRRFSGKLHGTYRVNKRTIWYQYLELYLHQWVSTSNINRKSKQVRSIQILFLQYVQD